MSQEFQIEHYLRSGHSLTPIEALNMFGCFRLSGRILNLRQQGLDIKTEIVKQNGKRFAKYFIAQEKPIEYKQIPVGKQAQLSFA